MLRRPLFSNSSLIIPHTLFPLRCCDEYFVARHTLQRARAVEESGIYGGGDLRDGARHRREHGDFHGRQRSALEAPALRAPRTAREAVNARQEKGRGGP